MQSSIPSNDEDEDEEDEEDKEEEGEQEGEAEGEGEEDEVGEDEEDEGEESGSFIALKRNMKKKATPATPEKNGTERGSGGGAGGQETTDVNMKQMASLAKEYTDEIINNEVYIILSFPYIL